jgi:hypothetical protein
LYHLPFFKEKEAIPVADGYHILVALYTSEASFFYFIASMTGVRGLFGQNHLALYHIWFISIEDPLSTSNTSHGFDDKLEKDDYLSVNTT